MKNNLNLLIGEDTELINFYKQEIIKKIDHTEEDVIEYDLSEESFASILDEALMPSLFSQTKIIIGTNLDISKISKEELTYLEKYLADKLKHIYIILITKKTDARLNAYKLFKDNFNVIDITKSDTEDDIISYIKKLISENHYKTNDSTIKYLLDKTGKDINNINNELNKLFIYKSEDKVITNSDIDKIVIDNIDNVMYEFTNAVLDNDITTITKMLNDFKLTNITFDYLIVTLANTFRQALTIKLLTNDNKSNLEIAKIIGRQAYFVKKMQERLYNYTDRDLTKYITKLANIDADFKSGKVTESALELFLIDKDR